MRRRKLFTLATGASAVLFVGVCVLWVRSERTLDAWDWEGGGCRHSIGSVAGHLYYDRMSAPTRSGFRPVGYSAAGRGNDPAEHLVPSRSFAGFTFTRARAGVLAWYDFRVPDWSVAALAATVPAVTYLRRRRRRRRSARGCCPACGYDLRATPDRCPECGAVPGGSNTAGEG